MSETARQIGVRNQLYCCKRKQYGGMTVNDAKKLKEVEKENAKLKYLLQF